MEFASFNAKLLVPGLWVVWFRWGVPLVGLVPVPSLWALLFCYLCLPLPGLWEGFGLSLLCPGCGLRFLWLVCLLALYVGFGLMLMVFCVVVVSFPSF